MLESFTVLTFAVLVGETFEVEAVPGKAVSMELVEAKEYLRLPGSAERANAERTPFSILFRSSKDCSLPQATYPFSHPNLGKFDLFIVPIQPDPEGHLYQAVFN